MNNLTTVYLTDEEAEMFKLFMKHQKEIMFIIENGINCMKSGQIIININHQGLIMGMETRTITRFDKIKKIDKV